MRSVGRRPVDLLLLTSNRYLGESADALIEGGRPVYAAPAIHLSPKRSRAPAPSEKQKRSPTGCAPSAHSASVSRGSEMPALARKHERAGGRVRVPTRLKDARVTRRPRQAEVRFGSCRVERSGTSSLLRPRRASRSEEHTS